MTTPSATQPGVQTEETTAADPETATTTTAETKEPALSARELVMEQITAQNEQRIVDEHKEKGITIEGLAPDTSQQVDTQMEDKPTVLEADLDKIFVKQKIDGEERLVSVADLNRDSQKHGAADKRLDEAARLLREAREQAAAIKTPPVGVAAEGTPSDSTTQADAEGDDPKAAAKRIVKALFEGDEDGAIEAVEKIVAGRQAPTQPDTQQIAQQVKQQMSVDSALEQFAKDYRDIVDDPYLASLADQFLDAEVQDPTKSYAEALDAAGKKTRDWLAAKTGQPAQTATPTMDRTQKLERKAGIDNVQALNTKATTAEEPVLSASDVIADMKKQRGLA